MEEKGPDEMEVAAQAHEAREEEEIEEVSPHSAACPDQNIYI